MKIVVIYKWAPDPQYATVADTGEINWGTKRAVSEYDPVAIHLGRLTADAAGAELIGITAGDSTAATPKATQAAAARGLDRLTVLADDALKDACADTYARALSAVIKNLGDDVALILAGEASADVGGKAVPGLVAGFLEIPSLAGVEKISAGENGFTVVRTSAGRSQTLELTEPAVLSLTTDAVSVPLIGMKDMMAARKKPVEKLTLADVSLPPAAGKAHVVSVERPEIKPRKQIIFDSENAAAELVAALREEGVL